MDRKQIEEKDLRLTTRLREIIHDKERPPAEERQGRGRYGIWLTVLCAMAILAAVAFFRPPPATVTPSGVARTGGEPAEEMDAAVRKRPPEERPSEASASADAETTPPAAPSSGPAASTLEKASLPVSRETGAGGRKATHAEAAAEAPFPAPITPEPSQETAPSIEAAVVAAPTSSPAVQIAEIFACSNVRNRRYVATRTVFSLKKSSKSFVWMNVLSEKPPFTLTHVYYRNGRRYCAVPLEIRHPRMRTWSSINLRSRKQCGEWRVAVMTKKGEVLDQVEFTVVP